MVLAQLVRTENHRNGGPDPVRAWPLWQSGDPGLTWPWGRTRDAPALTCLPFRKQIGPLLAHSSCCNTKKQEKTGKNSDFLDKKCNGRENEDKSEKNAL